MKVANSIQHLILVSITWMFFMGVAEVARAQQLIKLDVLSTAPFSMNGYGTAGNWSMDDDLFVGYDKEGNLVAVSRTLGVKTFLMQAPQTLQGVNCNFYAFRENENIVIRAVPVPNPQKVIVGDESGHADFIFPLTGVRKQLIQDNAETLFSLYPNPANAGREITLRLSAALGFVDIQITDMQGNRVWKGNNAQTGTYVQIILKEKGIYFIEYNTVHGVCKSRLLLLE